MATQTENLLHLKSSKAQLEVGLIYLKRRHSELERQLALVEAQARRGNVPADALAQLRRTVQDHLTQIERRQSEIDEIDGRIQSAQSYSSRNGGSRLSAEHDAVTAEIAQIRQEVLITLRALAGPLRRYEQLAERKGQLARELFAVTGRDQSYTNYIEGALLRQSEFEGELRYVVELLKKARIVA
jgi:chromosome segregation ATPase